MVELSGSGPISVMLAWARLRSGGRGALGVVAGECCCRVLLPHLSPVVLDRIDQVDGTVVVAAHPRGWGRDAGGAVGCRPGCTAATAAVWRICPSRAGRSR